MKKKSFCFAFAAILVLTIATAQAQISNHNLQQSVKPRTIVTTDGELDDID
jgi:hypothetical protein